MNSGSQLKVWELKTYRLFLQVTFLREIDVMVMSQFSKSDRCNAKLYQKQSLHLDSICDQADPARVD